jgi:penicillin-binding protein 1A
MRHISAFGFGPEALPANLTLALGTGQVTPLEMARGFSVFANGGFLVTPYIVERVTDSKGGEVFAATPAVACADCPGEPAAPQAISPANAFVMTDVMTDVIQRGTATSAKSLGRSDLAGKTGTTSDRRDAWFVGFNADVTAAAWVGFDHERSLGDNEEGGRTALPMWIAFMEEALRDRPEHRLPEPPGVVRMWVDRSSGRPTSAGASGAVFEAFLEAHVPQGDALAEAEEVGAESVEPATADDTLF